jgi:two-component system, LytTR family, response regulator LytT
MTVLIIEDEMLAAERLSLIIKQYDNAITILDVVESVEAAVEWLSTKAHPDLLMVDIHLADGHSFEIFKKVSVKKPIIFTTAYDQYALDAFQLFSIDYILKPITAIALANAINKYKLLANNFVAEDYGTVLQDVKESFTTQYKNRFLAKVGQRLFFVPVNDVAYFVNCLFSNQ